MQRYLAAGGYPVPRVYQADLPRGLVALEDVGDRTFESAVDGAPEPERLRFYRAAIAQIVALQKLGDGGRTRAASPFRAASTNRCCAGSWSISKSGIWRPNGA